MRRYADRIMEISDSEGTGDFTLLGAMVGYKKFNSVFTNTDTFSYCIEGQNDDGTLTGEWEVGTGYINQSTGKLVRQTVQCSTNNNQKVNFSDGQKAVWLTLSAEDIYNFESAEDLTSALDNAVATVQAQQTTSVNAVKSQQTTSVNAVKAQETLSVNAVKAQETLSVTAVQTHEENARRYAESAANSLAQTDISNYSLKKQSIAGQSAGVTTNPWYKFASVEIESNNTDKEAIFLVSHAYASLNGYAGILRAHIRRNTATATSVVQDTQTQLQWVCANDKIDPNKFALCYKVSDDDTKVASIELWCKADVANYGTWAFRLLHETTRSDFDTSWTLYKSYGTGSANLPSDMTAIMSTIAGAKVGDTLAMSVSNGDSQEVIKVYDDETGETNYGFEMVVSAGGNTFVGGGESATAVRNAITTHTSEDLYLTSDNRIYFYPNCNTVANRETAWLNADGSYTLKSNALTKGTHPSSSTWENINRAVDKSESLMGFSGTSYDSAGTISYETRAYYAIANASSYAWTALRAFVNSDGTAGQKRLDTNVNYLYFQNGAVDSIIQKNDISASISVRSGNSSTNGACLYLYGGSRSSGAGNFILRAVGSQNNDDTKDKYSDLVGTYNGNLTWKGTAVSLAGHTHSYMPLTGGQFTGSLSIKNSSVTKGTAPSATNYWAIHMTDSSGVTTASGRTHTLEGAVTTAKTTTFQMRAYPWVSGATAYDGSGLSVSCTSASVFTASCTGSFTATGDVIAYSDARLKENVETIDNALEKVMSIRGVTFTRNDVPDVIKDKRHMGVIAQEVLDVIPEVVFEHEEVLTQKQIEAGIEPKTHYGVSYGNITALLIEGMKEQQKIIESLKERIEKLEAK